jgi:hypothetical protein
VIRGASFCEASVNALLEREDPFTPDRVLNTCYHDRRVLGNNPLQRATPKGEDRPVCPVAHQATSSLWVKIQPGMTRLISAASLALNGRPYCALAFVL